MYLYLISHKLQSMKKIFYFAILDQEPGQPCFHCFLFHLHLEESKASALIFKIHLTKLEGARWNRTVPHLSFTDEANKIWLRTFCIYSTFHPKASTCFVSSDRQQGLMPILSSLIINFHRSGSRSLAS